VIVRTVAVIEFSCQAIVVINYFSETNGLYTGELFELVRTIGALSFPCVGPAVCGVICY